MRTAVLEELFPAPVRVFEMREAGDPAGLMPVELAAVARARPKRVREFAAGRACARAALADLGLPEAPLPPASDRSPVWPLGVVGSITHTTGFCAAAVAPSPPIRALGLDSELVGAPTDELWPVICRRDELDWIESSPPHRRSALVTLIFSAKEAAYKCQYPLTHHWLDFHDVKIQVADPAGGSGFFQAHILGAQSLAALAAPLLTGRYLFHEQFVSTGIALLGADARLRTR